MNITRQQFIQAIEAGIQGEPTLTEPERDALRQVAVSAKAFGTNFDVDCPAAQAGIYNVAVRKFGVPYPTGTRFASRFDKHLAAALYAEGKSYGSVEDGEYIRVIA